MNSAFRDKRTEFSMLTCLAGDYQQFGVFLMQMFDDHDWSHVSFIYDEDSDSCNFALSQVWTMMGGSNNDNISQYSVPADTNRWT